MKTKRQRVGDEGEQFAQKYLKKNGWEILATNVRLPWNDEVDVIARDIDDTLVFVEVKTVIGNFLNPEEQMTFAKIKKCMRAAEWIANKNPGLVKESVGWRIDCVALKKFGSGFEVHHYKQIV